MFGPGRQQLITSRIPALRRNVTTWESERRTLNRNIEHLEQARSRIQKVFDNSRPIPKNMRNRPGQKVPKTLFRGSHRTSMSNTLGEIRDALITQRNRHETNLEKIRRRITTLQGKRNTLTTKIELANRELTELQQEWLRATGTNFVG